MKKTCEVCGNPIFSKVNVCNDCKTWGQMLKAFHTHEINPTIIADELYGRLVYKFENDDYFYEGENCLIKEFQRQVDEELMDIIQQFTFWSCLK